MDSLPRPFNYGVFHVHVRKCEHFMHPHKCTDTLHITLVPREGTAWGDAQFYTTPDNKVDPAAAQVELELMAIGYEATWLWDRCGEGHGCVVGQFSREGTFKAVQDSGAYREYLSEVFGKRA